MSRQLFADFIQDDFYALKPCGGSVLLKEIAKEKQSLALPPANTGCIQWKPMPACKLPNLHDFRRKVCEDSVTGTTLSESKFVSCYDNADGRPKIYEATKRIASALNGIRQVVRTERDQGTQLEKMSVERHIKEKAHVEKRQRNTRTGLEHRHNEYFNMSEVEKHHFPQEWRNKTTGLSLEFSQDPFRKMSCSAAVDYYE